jgi:hypothetical protein
MEVARVLMHLDQEGERVAGSLREGLAAKAAVLQLDSELHQLLARLADLRTRCRGEVPEQTLGQLIQDALTWGEGVSRFLERIEREELQQEQRLKLEEALRALEGLLAGTGLAGWRKRWEEVRPALRKALEDRRPVAETDSLVLPFVHTLQKDLAAATDFAEHYRLGWADLVLDGTRLASEQLSQALTFVRNWLQEAVSRLQPQPSKLPPMPTGREPWCRGLVASLALALEFDLASSRAAAQGAAETLAKLGELVTTMQLGGVEGISGCELSCVQTLVLGAAGEGRFVESLFHVGRLVGLDRAQEFAATTIEAMVQHDPLWRPGLGDVNNPNFTDGLLLVDEVTQMERLRSRLPVPILLSLRTLAAADRNRVLLESEGCDPAWMRLLELGAFGAWLLAACWDHVGQTVNFDRLRDHLCDGAGRLRLELALPLAAVPPPANAPIDQAALLAALELLSARRGNDLSFASTWAFIQRFQPQFPALTAWLGRIPLGQQTVNLLSSGTPSSETDGLSQAERNARGEVTRPRHYRGVRAVEGISRLFRAEIARPFLRQCGEAETADELHGLEERIRKQRDKLDDEIERWSEQFLYPPEGRLRETLRRDCDGILEALQAYAEARVRHLERASESPGRPNRTALANELQHLAQNGWAGQEAAALLRGILLDSTLPTVTVPGDTLHDPTCWYLPGCALLWLDGELRLGSYAERLLDDLRGPGPVGYALTLADHEGKVGLASRVLESMPVSQPPDRMRDLEAIRARYLHDVETLRADVERLAAEEPLTEEEQEQVAIALAQIQEDTFLEALRLLGDVQAGLQLRLEDRGRMLSREFLAEQVGRLEEAALKLPHGEKRRKIRLLLVDLSERLDDEPGRIAVATALLLIYEQVDLEVPEGLRQAVRSPTTAPAPAVSTKTPLASLAATAPAMPAATRHFGVVKHVNRGGQFGFITPFSRSLLEGPDYHFARSVLVDQARVGDWGELLGAVVEFEPRRANSAQTNLPTSRVRLCSVAELSEIGADLNRHFGPCPGDIGLWRGKQTEQGLIITAENGIYRPAHDSLPPADGSLVRFQVLNQEDKLASALAVVEAGQIDPRRRELLTRIARMPGTGTMRPAGSPAASPTSPITSARLAQVRPAAANAIGKVRELIDLWHPDSPRHAQLVASVDALRAQGNASAAWWHAMTVYSHLLLLGEEPTISATEVLEQVRRDTRIWSNGTNFDAAANWLYQSLSCLVAQRPQMLDLERVYQFFLGLEDDRGSSPHFRLEVIAARLCDQIDQEQPNPEYWRRAIQHANRARILNPGQTEAHDLVKRIRKRREAPGADSAVVEAPMASMRSLAPADLRLPDDPVKAVQGIRAYYERTVSGRADLARAREFFAQNAGRPGIVRGQLVLAHARLLLHLGETVQAEQLAIQHAVQDEVDSWEPLLALLEDAWRALHLPLERVRSKLEQIGSRLPSGLGNLGLLLLARYAFEAGDYSLAQKAARTAEQIIPSPDSNQLLRRIEAMKAPRLKPEQAPAEDWTLEERRENAMKRIRQTLEAGAVGARLVEAVLESAMEVDVGPWLIHQLLVENRLNLDLSIQQIQRLVDRAWSLCPSPELVLVEAKYLFGEEEGYKREGGLESTGDQVFEAMVLAVREVHRSEYLERVLILLEHRPWCAFVFFDRLSWRNPDQVVLHWYKAESASRIERAADYFESALRCIGQMQRLSSLAVSNTLYKLKHYGLALAVAQSGDVSTRPVQDMIRLAQQACRLEPWRWPALLQAAKFEERWSEAADVIIPVLMAAPGHYPAGKIFLDIFTHRVGEERGLVEGASNLALCVVRHLRTEPGGRDVPELLVLEAELLFHRATLAGDLDVPDEPINECHRLCDRACQLRDGFAPARALRERLDSRKQRPLQLDREFNGFYIVENPQRGSFSEVAKARRPDSRTDLPEFVALKRMLTDSARPEQRDERQRSLQRDATILTHLKHPHIVRTLEYMPDASCLVLEWVEGAPLWDLINLDSRNHCRLPWREAAEIGRQVADALGYAAFVVKRDFGGESWEEADFAHRDLHPRNVMLDRAAGSVLVKVLDFGQARLPAGRLSSADLNRMSVLIYRAPNYYKSRNNIRSDMFALGVILYELICGQLQGPYKEDVYRAFLSGNLPTEREAELRQRPLREVFAAQTSAVGELEEPPRELEDILAKLTAFRVQDRYDNWEAVKDNLTRLLDSAP